jgi:hypothetical protein
MNARNKYDKLDRCTFPKGILMEIVISGYLPALTVLIVLYETCYLDWEHKNPVTLTSESLAEYRITRWQKYKALQVLERQGWIIVLRTPGKNPKVKLNWRLPWE